MTPEEINQAIAEWMGYQEVTQVSSLDNKLTLKFWKRTDDVRAYLEIPNYYGDLNAVHEAEMKLRGTDWEQCNSVEHHSRFNRYLSGLSAMFGKGAFCATAPQRAEALLRTLNLWRDQ